MTSPIVESYLRLAEEELAAAKRIIDAFPRQAAYFMAQAAEKLVRAVISAEQIQLGPTHDIGRLVSALPVDHPLRPYLMPLHALSTASTRYRYPTPVGKLAPPPHPDQLRRQTAEIEMLIPTVRRHLLRT